MTAVFLAVGTFALSRQYALVTHLLLGDVGQCVAGQFGGIHHNLTRHWLLLMCKWLAHSLRTLHVLTHDLCVQYQCLAAS
jgi:hypothetical protein